MTFQHLDLGSVVRVPDAASVVRTRCNDPVTLGVEGNFGNFCLMTLKHRCAGPRKDVINSCETIRTRRRQLVTRRVEASVKHFVVVASERLNALSTANIP